MWTQNNKDMTKVQTEYGDDELYKQKSQDLILTTAPTSDSLQELHDASVFIQNRLYLLSAVVGDIKSPKNKYKGYIGLAIWITNLIVHFSLDFYEAYEVFHVSWATSIGLYLIMFLMVTVFIPKHTVPWYAKVVKKLAKEKVYTDTLTKLKFIFKVLPFLIFSLSLIGAAAQYGCYAYDDALTLKLRFNANSNGTSELPDSVELIVNIMRFTSLSHIYYMMYLVLLLNMIVFYTVVHSQNSFNAFMGKELKSHPPSMKFQEAVSRFNTRTKLLRGASESTSVVLSTLLLATSTSFVINAYNFLFIKRFAIYIWFAIAPLIWTIVPLIGSALVTSSYKQLKFIVMQSWVEIPEKYDELWTRVDPLQQIHNKIHPNWKMGLENMRRRRRLREEKEKEEYNSNNKNKLVARVRKSSKVFEFLNKTVRKVSLTSTAQVKDATSISEAKRPSPRLSSTSRPLYTSVVIEQNHRDEKINDKTKDEVFELVAPKKGRKLGQIVGVAQNINKLTPKRKFNYEKYHKFLELTLDTVGFSLGKVTITWDRVSFFMVLLLTMVGMFAQNAFLK